MPMHNPPHPGEMIKEVCLPSLGLTIKQAAEGLCVSPRTLSKVIHGKADITADMAIRLAEAFGSSPETWLGMQHAYDLWQAQHQPARAKVKKYWPKESREAV